MESAAEALLEPFHSIELFSMELRTSTISGRQVEIHTLKVSNVVSFCCICRVCEKKFVSKTSLQFHMKTHMDVHEATLHVRHSDSSIISFMDRTVLTEIVDYSDLTLEANTRNINVNTDSITVEGDNEIDTFDSTHPKCDNVDLGKHSNTEPDNVGVKAVNVSDEAVNVSDEAVNLSAGADHSSVAAVNINNTAYWSIAEAELANLGAENYYSGADYSNAIEADINVVAGNSTCMSEYDQEEILQLHTIGATYDEAVDNCADGGADKNQPCADIDSIDQNMGPDLPSVGRKAGSIIDHDYFSTSLNHTGADKCHEDTVHEIDTSIKEKNFMQEKCWSSTSSILVDTDKTGKVGSNMSMPTENCQKRKLRSHTSKSTKDASQSKVNSNNKSRKGKNKVTKQKNGTNKVKKQPLECDLCGKKIIGKQKFSEHMNIHSGEKPYVCSVCGHGYSKRSELAVHRKRHTGDLHACEKCRKQFTKRSELITHATVHTGEKPFLCTVCGKQFRLKEQVTQHIKVHTGEKPHVCKVCGKSFAKRSNLNAHGGLHEDRSVVCYVCGKSFKYRTSLIRHVRLEHEEKYNSCDICGQVLKGHSSLKQHYMRKHTKVKPFVCSECGEKFFQKSELEDHTRTHTGEKPFLCTRCDNSFRIRSSLMWHIKTQHPEMTPGVEECSDSLLPRMEN